MHHTLVSYIVYLYEWMGAEIDTFTHPNFSKFGDQAAALAHALSAEVTPRRLLRWNALSEGPGCPTVSENSSSNPSFKPGSMLVRSKPVIIFMYIYVCVYGTSASWIISTTYDSWDPHPVIARTPRCHWSPVSPSPTASNSRWIIEQPQRHPI